MIYVTRKEHFNAAHKLQCSDWDEEKNEEVFGKCANGNWHGHNYDLWVTVRGEPDIHTGFVLNTQILSKIIKEQVTEKLDHRNLNLDVDLGGLQPSSENLAIWIWNTLKPFIKGCELHSVKVQETENIYVEYFG